MHISTNRNQKIKEEASLSLQLVIFPEDCILDPARCITKHIHVDSLMSRVRQPSRFGSEHFEVP